jgi:hypothetical protein
MRWFEGPLVFVFPRASDLMSKKTGMSPEVPLVAASGD